METVLGRTAVGCAVFLLFAPLGGRTMWVAKHSTATDAAGYNVVAVLCGIVALAALAVALWVRPDVLVPMLGALVAVAAFSLSAYVSGVDVWARLHGQVWVYAGWTAESMSMGKKWAVYPAWGPPYFTAAAIVGALATLALAILWLRPAEEG